MALRGFQGRHPNGRASEGSVSNDSIAPGRGHYGAVHWGHPRALLKYRLSASLQESLIQLTGVWPEESSFFKLPGSLIALSIEIHCSQGRRQYKQKGQNETGK